MKKYIMLALLIAAGSVASVSQAAECEANGLGGDFCVNDNGSTSDSMPNEAGGTDTLSSNGDLTSTVPDDTGDNAEMEGSSLSSDNDSAGVNTNDGSATSSMDMLNQP